MVGLLAAGLVFVGGSVGAESLSGVAMINEGHAPSFFALTLIEETLEMTGLALCVASLLHLLQHRSTDGGTAYRVAALLRRKEPVADDETSGRADKGETAPAVRGGAEVSMSPSKDSPPARDTAIGGASSLR